MILGWWTQDQRDPIRTQQWITITRYSSNVWQYLIIDNILENLYWGQDWDDHAVTNLWGHGYEPVAACVLLLLMWWIFNLFDSLEISWILRLPEIVEMSRKVVIARISEKVKSGIAQINDIGNIWDSWISQRVDIVEKVKWLIYLR